ncbi:MAG TPA: hypothetical protein PJ986_05980 [Gammaproteobacteria bacterium]|mgnify:CR=1 FL=1|nr:hypothetical protein [Gammaproteobacteria bacterium]
MKSLTRLAATLLALSLSAPMALAATLNQTFMNDFTSNALYLWSDVPAELQLGAVAFGSGMQGWSVQSASAAALVLTGPTVAAGQGRFTLRLDYLSRPFSLQWAEVFFDSGINRILGAGTLSYSASGWANANAFTHAADIPHQFAAPASVPLPPSAVLLSSALLFLPLRRLQRRRTRA